MQHSGNVVVEEAVLHEATIHGPAEKLRLWLFAPGAMTPEEQQLPPLRDPVAVRQAHSARDDTTRKMSVPHD